MIAGRKLGAGQWMLLKTNDVKGDIEGAIVKTTKGKGEVEEETTDGTGLNQKMSTAPATLDDIEKTTRTGASAGTGRDPGTTHDESDATARDHPDTNDAGGQKAAPARHRPEKPAGPYHLKTNPTAATPASKTETAQPTALLLPPRPNRNPITNPPDSWPRRPTPSPAPPKSSNTTNRRRRGNRRRGKPGDSTCSGSTT